MYVQAPLGEHGQAVPEVDEEEDVDEEPEKTREEAGEAGAADLGARPGVRDVRRSGSSVPSGTSIAPSSGRGLG